jgi:hypothetical protein
MNEEKHFGIEEVNGFERVSESHICITNLKNLPKTIPFEFNNANNLSITNEETETTVIKGL